MALVIGVAVLEVVVLVTIRAGGLEAVLVVTVGVMVVVIVLLVVVCCRSLCIL